MKYKPLENLTEFEEFIKNQPELKLVKDPLGRVNYYQVYIIKNAYRFTWYPETERLVINHDEQKEIVVCLSNFNVVIAIDFEDEKILRIALKEKKTK